MTEENIVKIDSVSFEENIPAEAPAETCKCVKCRIKRFRLVQSLGALPTKPVSKIVGKHEYLRLDDVNEKYWTEFEHEFLPFNDKDIANCNECAFYATKKEIEDKTTFPVCWTETFESTLGLKLQELKTSGRKVLDARKEWGGWTIKMMVPAT